MMMDHDKGQRDRLIRYNYLSFEMGLDREKGIGSVNSGRYVAKQGFGAVPSEECMTKTQQSSVSMPASLNNPYFKMCYSVYLVLICIVSIFHFCLFIFPLER